MPSEVYSDCPHCGRRSKTIGHRCTNCGLIKLREHLPEPRKLNFSNSFWDDIDLLWALGAGSVVVATVVAVIKLGILSG